MTASAKIQSLAPALRKRSHHRVDHSRSAKAALQRFAAGVRAMRGDRPQREIAEGVGISVNQYSNIECGVNWPSMPVYRKLCKVLKIQLPALLR
jgi:transcriptional regulator with XRE-family HTH domain